MRLCAWAAQKRARWLGWRAQAVDRRIERFNGFRYKLSIGFARIRSTVAASLRNIGGAALDTIEALYLYQKDHQLRCETLS
jgi:hypothetical protein